ncbi:MAG TPA: alpha/beta hydrolase-fold protein [Blastocatellia bacterium]|nr:alpha/beta hydrolase-fold protein [Blastocatellia bacterium]
MFYHSIVSSALAVAFVGIVSTVASASRLVESKLETKLLPTPVEFNVLLPEGYEDAKEPLPLLLFLHGGGGDRSFLTRMRPTIDEMWKAGTLPKMVVVTPSAGRSFYMDYKDGSQKWESFIIGPFLDHLRESYKVRRDRGGTLVFGISMGGLGALRLCFKYPDRFGGLAALEPGIDPALKWKDVLPRNRFYRGQDLMETIFGKPFDADYWEKNNPASLAVANAEKVRASGLQVYIDVGDEDSFNLHEAAEFMHRILWDNKILHEYHLVRGADHVGRTLRRRSMEGLEFLARVLNPPPPDLEAETLRRRLAPLKRQAEIETQRRSGAKPPERENR